MAKKTESLEFSYTRYKWTDDAIARLIDLRSQGLPASRIASTLNKEHPQFVNLRTSSVLAKVTELKAKKIIV